ncbi:MAG: DMT family transporter [Anaerolineales bacterium]|jgi:drug/metabolite transporter (DMT)-like permease|nr:DMT family transporter [Anaerolineales bacterium]
MSITKGQRAGISAALSSAFLLGLAPVFGRWAILSGFSALLTVALRTGLAALMIFLILLLFRPQFLYIFPVGLAGCFLAGAINGLGSLFYYVSLSELPASVGQLLYAIYPVFVAMFSILDRQPISRLTGLRMGLALVAVLLLVNPHGGNNLPLWAILMMLGSAALYALHIPINQRVLYEIPAPTVTFYTLLAMSLVTLPAYLILDRHMPGSEASWTPVALLTLVTFASRFTLFMGIKKIGGVQTALLGLSEIFVTVIVSYFLLDESLTLLQWIGAGILATTLLLASFEKGDMQRPKGGWLAWIHPPQITPIPWNLDD